MGKILRFPGELLRKHDTFRRRAVSNTRGMTLVEVIAVIVLLGLILAVVAQGVFKSADASKQKLNGLQMEKVKQALDQYRLEFNQYPSNLNHLLKPPADLVKGKVFAPVVGEKDLKDVWGFPFVYEPQSNNRSFKLTSLGSDGIAGGDGTKADFSITP